MSAGNIVHVEETLAGSELAADAASSSTTITVEDPTDFQPDGGELLIGLEEKAYSAVDDLTGVITLDTGLASSYLAGDPVYVLPTTTERFAHVQLEGQDETLQARIPHNFYPLLAVGLRDPDADELELVELDRDPSGELFVADVLGVLPTVDTAYASTDTPPVVEPTSDGSPPGSSPPATVKGGVNFLVVQWPAIANADPVTYEVHLSTSSGFTPGVATHVGTVRGTMFVARNLPGLAPLAMGVTYYARIVATDADGAAAAGVEGSGVLNPDAGGDVIAGVVTTEMLEAVMVLASTLVAGTLGAGRVELGVASDESGLIGIQAYDEDGTTVNFLVDAETGQVYVRGRLDFGLGSRLLANDIVELLEQSAGSFQTPSVVQTPSNRGISSTASATWASPTSLGNTLVMSLHLRDADGTPPTPSVPSGWTQVANVSSGTGYQAQRLVVYKIENAAARSGVESFAIGDSVNWTLIMAELAGTGAVDVVATNSGSGTTPDSGTTATTTQAEEVWLAFLTNVKTAIDGGPALFATSPTNGFTNVVSQVDFVGDETAVQQLFTKIVAATGAANMSATLGAARQWLGAIITLKAKPTGVDTPDTGKVRVYARDVSSVARLHAKQEDGVEGALVLGKAGEVWRLEVVASTVDLPSTAAHTGGSVTASVAGLAVGDYCFVLARSSASGRSFQLETISPVCSTAGQITLDYFNADSATTDPPSQTIYFLVIHRS